MKVNIGVSRRHVHLTKEDVKILFGDGYELTKFRDLSQPGQYACNEKVILKGERGSIPDVRVLGPERDKTQAEVTKTDCYRFGINAPVRNSGDLDDASEITIIGPKGEITKNAAIIAARHLHINPTDAKKLGIIDKKFVTLKVGGEKPGILENVYVRVSESFVYEVHLDTDDANAFLIEQNDEGEIIIK